MYATAMVSDEVVEAIAAPRIGCGVNIRPNRTPLSLSAKRRAPPRGNIRSLVLHVLVAPRHDRTTNPTTMQRAPRALLQLGFSLRKRKAARIANRGAPLR